MIKVGPRQTFKTNAYRLSKPVGVCCLMRDNVSFEFKVRPFDCRSGQGLKVRSAGKQGVMEMTAET